MMKTWLALIVAPLVALIDQAAAFALVGWACAHQSTLPLHLAHALCLVITTGIAMAAWASRRESTEIAAQSPEVSRQRRFLERIGPPVALIAMLVIASMWIPTWLIASCSA
jgi:hypothetical protein